ncbi:hypothetical protein CIPAW_04G175100 [Carya illinoinensis]|uniref:Uncharacterized protein n=1 Tax=Carya illinoinensis TaxID=32201 RepID=A0A8T1QXD9_CARIL|nr:hypothetical protein CIPAW_04G175100 [Carya illinoinensis]
MPPSNTYLNSNKHLNFSSHFSWDFYTFLLELYPDGNPSRNSGRPRLNAGRRGGLEIVFNQQ